MLGMLGLEGSGFTICLGIILLLTGIVMYYCKSKISECEHKVDSMFKLIAALHDEVGELKKNSVNQQHTNYTSSEHMSSLNVSDSQNMDEPIELESDEESENESENDSESESENENENENNSKNEDENDNDNKNQNKSTSLFSNHPYQELIPEMLTENIGKQHMSEDSESESDNDSNTSKSSNNNDTSAKTIKVVDLGEIEELEIDVESSDSEQSEQSDINNENEQGNENVVDYSKLQVVALKKLVAERKLSKNVNKLRKAELVQLLESS